LKLPPEARPLLKRPLGKLFTSTKAAVEHIKKVHPAKLIAVGDTVAAELLGAGLEPDLIVVDFQVKRAPADDRTKRAIETYEVHTVRVRNPAGSLTPELYNIFETIKIPAKIIVEGEDDLATIPAVLSAPIGSIVAYGQPNEGMVLVEVDEHKKREFRKLFDLFDRGMS
jgi:uncharacterized protein (UPF0218 family)